jgi:putative toxin-antitoxin system antitoxin component (TIGR02293 family)
MATTTEMLTVKNLAHLESLPESDLIEALTQGLPASLAREFASQLELTMEKVAELLRLTPRTLQRRLEEGRLDISESERLWELNRLFFRAIEVLESEAGVVQWFKSPIQALGWATPLSFASTAVGLRQLENILGRIEYGVFS